MSNKPYGAFAKVRLAGGREVYLPISSPAKPAIPSDVMEKWQEIANLAAKALDVPAGLVTRLKPEALEICVASDGEDNPFKPMDSLQLGIGMYCETTTGTRHALHVPDALADEAWKNNPSVDFNLIAYLGMPLKWPDGELFGTFCMLDTKAHEHSETSIRLLAHFRDAVETELQRLQEREQLRQLNVENELSLREAHHRIKNHLNMLSGVLQLSSCRGVLSQEEFEAFVQDLSRRIQAIATLHSHIALAKDAQIELSEFLQTIATTSIDSLSDKKIALRFAAEPITVGRQTFFHTGLLLSELITNALKHAFGRTDQPEISITLQNRDEHTFLLRFADNGSGLSKDVDLQGCQSIGMMLINDLPKQMGGSYTLNTTSGTVYEFILAKQSG